MRIGVVAYAASVVVMDVEQCGAARRRVTVSNVELKRFRRHCVRHRVPIEDGARTDPRDLDISTAIDGESETMLALHDDDRVQTRRTEPLNLARERPAVSSSCDSTS